MKRLLAVLAVLFSVALGGVAGAVQTPKLAATLSVSAGHVSASQTPITVTGHEHSGTWCTFSSVPSIPTFGVRIACATLMQRPVSIPPNSGGPRKYTFKLVVTGGGRRVVKTAIVTQAGPKSTAAVVPNFVGMTWANAQQRLIALGVLGGSNCTQLSSVITSQNPKPGTTVSTGGTEPQIVLIC